MSFIDFLTQKKKAALKIKFGIERILSIRLGNNTLGVWTEKP